MSFSEIIYKNYRLLLFTLILSIGAGVIVTVVSPNKYSATGVVYPSTSNSLIESINSPAMGFQRESDILIQVLQSNRMKAAMVDHFKLYDRYDLDTTAKGWVGQAYSRLSGEVQVQRNKDLAVEIKAETEDASYSKELVNFIIDNADSINAQILKSNASKAIKHYKKELKKLIPRLDSLLEAVLNITVEGNQQVDPVSERRLISMNSRRENLQFTPIDSKIKQIGYNQLTKQQHQLIDNYLFEYGNLNHIKQSLLNAENRYAEPLAGINVLSRAYTRSNPVKPSILKNILIFTALGLFLCFFAIIVRNQFQMIRNSRNDQSS